jgi:DNA repair protein RecO (recombination protein O)
MMHKTKAIVLHHVKYGESSIIVTLYTEHHGRLTCMVNGVRSKKPRFSATLFQPLTILEIDFYSRPSREIQRLKDALCPLHYQSVPFSFSKSAVALFVAEVLFLVLREEESNPVLFSFLYTALQMLDTSEEGSSTFHHWFMLQLTRYLGFFPPYSQFDGSALPPGDLQVFSGLNSRSAEALKTIALNPQSPPDLTGLSQSDRNELLESIIRYYRIHVDGFSRLRSFTVLQEVFGQRTV